MSELLLSYQDQLIAAGIQVFSHELTLQIPIPDKSFSICLRDYTDHPTKLIPIEIYAGDENGKLINSNDYYLDQLQIATNIYIMYGGSFIVKPGDLESLIRFLSWRK